MKTNTAAQHHYPQTHQGAPSPVLELRQQLERSVMACLLWENGFYEDGTNLVDRIERLAKEVINQPRHSSRINEPWHPGAHFVANLAIRAREEQHLRHVPLLLCSILAGEDLQDSVVSRTIGRVIQRPDELCELVSLHAKRTGASPHNFKRRLSNQIKKGLALAFPKFSAYQLAKYNRKAPIRLRDVLFLCHAKPKDAAQAATWKALAEGTLNPPDTWEVELSRGKDKRETFERLLREDKLGYLALLRNLKGMFVANVDQDLIRQAILAGKGANRVLPFRFIAAAIAAPWFEKEIDQALYKAVNALPLLKGRTLVLVDVSRSMNHRVSANADMTRMVAAAALAALVRAEDKMVYSFSYGLKFVPPRHGMAMVEAVLNSQEHGGTYLGKAIRALGHGDSETLQVRHDRMIVITDEQSHDEVPGPACDKAYMINVATEENSVGTKQGWNRITGWSENVLRYIGALEQPAE